MKKARPKILKSTTFKVPIHGTDIILCANCGEMVVAGAPIQSMYVTISHLEGKPFEVFATVGKSGSCDNAWLEALTRCITIGLRFGVPATEFIKGLRGIRCKSLLGKNSSPPDAIGKCLEEFLEENSERPKVKRQNIFLQIKYLINLIKRGYIWNGRENFKGTNT